ncbi:unnamed protein product (macronuclear) [Paramecium tetraurelia]|uniref:Myb-like DNA-binding domain containing protein n=1 Tax=Paramecium tetraurelia TaxID=5888 RepID=A0CVQ4_PARTE|nr:uncharacterized protein GSPATT00011039001 [Paramecium tetraurelia]CAK74871.1 unnamed protein product [Paramecium tetraurelia]|eukprot:XP_001442268.1 hypothetical protein (macronuclear) [Paramecium tetraurelia strain d4-2]
MFVDLWLNFCCARKPKQEAQDQPISVKEDSNKPILDTGQVYAPSPVEQKALQSTSQELRQKLQEAQEKRQQQQQPQQQNHFQNMINKGAVKTSIEMEVEPVEGFLSLSDNKSNKMASWEALELSRQNDVLGQLAQFSILAKSVSSNNGPYQGSNPGSQPASDQQIMSGPYPQQNIQNLAQTAQLDVIEEYPKKSMMKSQSQISLETGKIEKKRITKDKKHQKEKAHKGSANDNLSKKEVTHAKLWDKNEDAILRQAYINFNGNWRKIAEQLPGRNMNQCSQRWRRLNPQENNKKKWEFEDDQKIIQLVKQYDKNWAEIAKHLPGKSGKQIRERYLNKLDPSINTASWTKEEDDIILKVYKQHGPKWSIASKQLKGRPENTVKNRFYSYIRRVFLGQQNPYSVVLNNGDISGIENTLSQDSESIKQPLSMDQTPSFTASSYLSSFMDDDYMEDEDEPNEQEDQFKI